MLTKLRTGNIQRAIVQTLSKRQFGGIPEPGLTAQQFQAFEQGKIAESVSMYHTYIQLNNNKLNNENINN